MKDGSGGSWPLYARIEVSSSGAPNQTTFSDPVTGNYSIGLASGRSYAFRVTAVSSGYTAAGGVVTVAATAPGEATADWSLVADPLACAAPGYSLSTSGLVEDFNAGSLPPGWSVANDSEGGTPWEIVSGRDPCQPFSGRFFEGNRTGGDGAWAMPGRDCSLIFSGIAEDTSLITPAVDLSGSPNAVVRFRSDFPCCDGGEIADVDVSTDGGATWSNALRQTANARGPRIEQADITSLAAGRRSVRARFHYSSASLGLFWQVDDVLLGQAACSRAEGGLVVGNVRDANTDAGANGATVRSLTDGASTTTFATPEDPNQDDGLYVLFAGAGPQRFEASWPSYSPQTETIAASAGGAVRLDFRLPAGQLTASPRPLSATAAPGQSVVQVLTLTNTGGADAAFEIHETPPAGTILSAHPIDLEFPYGVLFDTGANDLWISNIHYGDPPGDDRNYRFSTDGTQTGDTIDVRELGITPMDGAYNPATGKLWQVAGLYRIGCVHEMDPATKALTGDHICPEFTVQQSALAYNPTTGTFYSGSIDDSTLNHFNASGEILETRDVVPSISGLAFNPATGHLFVLHQAVEGAFTGPDVLVVDPANDYAILDSFFIGEPGEWSFGARGMEIDCKGHLWLVDEPGDAAYLLEVDSGEPGLCDATIPWLSASPTSGNISGLSPSSPSGASTREVAITFNATGLAAGIYQAQLFFETDTPYAIEPVPVEFTVCAGTCPAATAAASPAAGAAESLRREQRTEALRAVSNGQPRSARGRPTRPLTLPLPSGGKGNLP